MLRLLTTLIMMLALTGCSRYQALHCDDDFIAISSLQAGTELSPKLGQKVRTRGVLTSYLYPDSERAGWLLQQPGTPSLQAASQAIFLPDFLPDPEHDQNSLRQLTPGRLLAVRGKVAEIEQMTSLVDLNWLDCGPAEVEPLELSLPLPESLSWESLEGMWLRFKQPLVVNSTFGLGRYGELTLADKRLWAPTQIHPPGAKAQAHERMQQQRTLVLGYGSLQQNPDPLPYPPGGLSPNRPLRLGDTLTQLEGFLVQDSRGYRLEPSRVPQWQPANPRPKPPAPRQPEELRVASFNLLNFFTGADQNPPFPTRRGASNQFELERQSAKLSAAILALDADILGLIELENNGYQPGSALETLVATLNTQTERPYAMVTTDQRPGNDVIKVGLIYRPDAVVQAGLASTLQQPPFDQLHRAPVVQSFRHHSSNQLLTVSVNHFKSKGGCPTGNHPNYRQMRDHGDGQACWNQARIEAATALQQWLNTEPTGVSTPYQLLMGDLNAYRMEDPIRLLEQAGWHYLENSTGEPSYSFVFRGKKGALDHALASPALAALNPRIKHWAINADEPVLLQYSLRHKNPAQQQKLYAPDAFRSSDHDPILITLRFDAKDD